MNAESVSERQALWTLAVRRSFGVPDTVDGDDARNAVVERLRQKLEDNGWHTATREIAEPILEALIELAANGDLDNFLLSAGTDLSAETMTARAAAHRVIDKGMTAVDPEHLVFDVRNEHPPAVVAAVQYALDQVVIYVRQALNSEASADSV